MKRFHIMATETYSCEYCVNAEDYEDAIAKAKRMAEHDNTFTNPEHRDGISFACVDSDPYEIIGYEIRGDMLDDGTRIYDVYELMRGNSVCLESFQDPDNAVKYIRSECEWNGEIVKYNMEESK